MRYRKIRLLDQEVEAIKGQSPNVSMSDAVRLALGLEPLGWVKKEDGISRQLRHYRKKKGLLDKPEKWRKK